MTSHADTSSVLRHAEVAVALARSALIEAEQFGATERELLQLSEVVITRQLRVYDCRRQTGWEPSAARRSQMARDETLMSEPMIRWWGTSTES